MSTAGRILVTGATGFVGRAVWPALEEAGYVVRGLSRSADLARARWPDRDWVQGDVATGEGVQRALEDCRAALYLVHGMGRGDADYRERDRLAAADFSASASRAGLSRIIYLGGVAPQGTASEHLASRLEVGEALRSSGIPSLELRASMIIGHGSLSWLIVRDLAARLPFMVLPRWMRHLTQPVAIQDVVVALVRGLSVSIPAGASFDLPGPESLSEKEIVVQTAGALGLRPPIMLEVPVLSPWLSSHWIHVVTRAEWGVAREIVLGLAHDLLARNDAYWTLIGLETRIHFAEAARRAVADERKDGQRDTGFAAWVESGMRRFRGTQRPPNSA
ncbi:MAG TPA: NAD-dependent epimerase/dehydratase family protein [Armatimonadota bacterium]|jgi:uncharacterized protein YbjT (DUF2867 family)